MINHKATSNHQSYNVWLFVTTQPINSSLGTRSHLKSLRVLVLALRNFYQVLTVNSFSNAIRIHPVSSLFNSDSWINAHGIIGIDSISYDYGSGLCRFYLLKLVRIVCTNDIVNSQPTALYYMYFVNFCVLVRSGQCYGPPSVNILHKTKGIYKYKLWE